ncbi:ribosomal protein S18-alanine N-acetyltransferase [Chloroflexota bacterium]
MSVEDIPQANEIDRECFPAQWPPLSYKREILSGTSAHYFVACNTEEPLDPSGKGTATQKQSSFGSFVRKMSEILSGKQASSPNTNRRIVGLAGVWIMAEEAHLTTIGVRKAYRRQGIGELLLIAAIILAATHNVQVLTLEVRASNIPAITLYEKYGLSKIGIHRAYYPEDGEDALVMSTHKLTSTSFQSRFEQLKQAHTQMRGPTDCQIG